MNGSTSARFGGASHRLPHTRRRASAPTSRLATMADARRQPLPLIGGLS
ncbi:MAG: hypothetical protein LBR32_01650 [Propionibacteriaceae bacterium]|jgi:hypothetical protein|nr:hypothetical protein [Propionibacteriaceae bacterium]